MGNDRFQAAAGDLQSDGSVIFLNRKDSGIHRRSVHTREDDLGSGWSAYYVGSALNGQNLRGTHNHPLGQPSIWLSETIKQMPPANSLTLRQAVGVPSLPCVHLPSTVTDVTNGRPEPNRIQCAPGA
jgi:hypothetical protein